MASTQEVPLPKQTEGTLRDIAFSFFGYQPLNKTIIDPYNDMVINGLRETLEVPLFYETPQKFGMVRFRHILPVPPYEGSIMPLPNVAKIEELKKKHSEELAEDIAELEEAAKVEKQIVKLEADFKKLLKELDEEEVEEATREHEIVILTLRAGINEKKTRLFLSNLTADLIKQQDDEIEMLEDLGDYQKTLADELEKEIADARSDAAQRAEKIYEGGKSSKSRNVKNVELEEEIAQKVTAIIEKGEEIVAQLKKEFDDAMHQLVIDLKGEPSKSYNVKNIELEIVARIAAKKKEQNEKLHEALVKMYGGIPQESWLTAAKARQRGKNYMLSIYADIYIYEYKKRVQGGGDLLLNDTDDQNADIPPDRYIREKVVSLNISLTDGGKKVEPVIIKNVNLFDIPLMTGSHWDWLNIANIPKRRWNQFQECDLNPLSNFIMVGKEKAFVTQIKSSHNEPRCVLEKSPSKEPVVVCDLRCSTHSRRSNLIKLKFAVPAGKSDIKDAKICFMIMPFMKDDAIPQKTGTAKAKPAFNVFWVFRFYVIWHHFNKYGSDAEPLEDGVSTRAMFTEFNRTLLDVTSAEQQESGTVTTYRRVVEQLLDTIENARSYKADDIESDADFISYLHSFTKGAVGNDMIFSVNRLKMLFDSQFMPHVICPEYEGPNEITIYPKFTALVQMLVKYVKCYAGVRALDDRDSVEEQQLATAGMEIGVLVKKGFGKVKARLRKWLIDGEYPYSQFGEQVRNMGVAMVTSQLISSFRTGNWGLDGGGPKRPGVVQMHETASILSQWNMVRKSSIPANKNSNIEKPRRVHHTTYGIFDPTNTPDNEAVGLNRSLCLSVYVTSDNPSAYKEIVNFLHVAIESESDTAFESRGQAGDVKVMPCYLDNVFICYGTKQVYEDLRKLKLKGDLGIHTEVYIRRTIDDWEEVEEIRIRTNAGRAMRPLLLVTGKPGEQEIPALNLFRNAQKGREQAGSHLETLETPPISFLELIQHQVAEFVSPGEFQEFEVAVNYAHFIKGCQSGRQFTHIELDPYMAMSVEVATQPFPGLNPNPRVLYYAAMSRQPLSIPFATYRTRLETEIRTLNYVHKPLVTTDVIKILGLDQQGFGSMVYCAVKSKKATDEDATVWKKSFFERGGMQGTIYNTYTITAATTVGDEEEKEKDNPAIYNEGLIRVRREIGAPDILDEDEEDIKTAEIDQLRAREFAAEEENREFPFPEGVAKLSGATNVLIRPKQLIARYRAKQEITSEVEKLRLAGKRSGFVTLTDVSGSGAERQQKIVVRFPHYPRQGDKFANRYAQKGVVGDVIPDEAMPYIITPAGNITPDVIFSPTSFTSRMTAGMMAEMWAGQAIVAPDTHRIVKNLYGWNRGDLRPIPANEYVAPQFRGLKDEKGEPLDYRRSDEIKRDFWIPLVGALIKPGHPNLGFKLLSRIEADERNKKRIKNTPQRTVEKAKESNVDFGSDRGWEQQYGKEIAGRKKQGWIQVYGLVISKNVAEEDFIVPTEEYVSVLKTKERAILFSQLPDNLQIAWYLENLETIIPLYMFRFPETWPKDEAEELKDATAFRNPDRQKIKRILKSRGFASKGKYKMIDGMTGEQSSVTIFAAPVYWMQLRHLTESKYQVRDQGSMSISSRSAAKGKAVGGAVRSGELSHSALLAHGAMDYLAERFMTAADKYDVLLCGSCGEQCYRVAHTANIVCDRCGGKPVVPKAVTVPYSGMRLISMLTAAGIRPRLQTRNNPLFENTGIGEGTFVEPPNEGVKNI
uniref:DNA-directed RNA polymerase n=1 Tax=viral metagenome TaxID=1070528 RepID=A0A6C0CG72_9ZZZZ